MLSATQSLFAYIVISSCLWVSFLSFMFLVADDKDNLSKRSKSFLISKIVLCLIIITAAILFVTTFNDTVVLVFAGPAFLFWALFTTYLNYKQETVKK